MRILEDCALKSLKDLVEQNLGNMSMLDSSSSIWQVFGNWAFKTPKISQGPQMPEYFYKDPYTLGKILQFLWQEEPLENQAHYLDFRILSEKSDFKLRVEADFQSKIPIG